MLSVCIRETLFRRRVKLIGVSTLGAVLLLTFIILSQQAAFQTFIHPLTCFVKSLAPSNPITRFDGFYTSSTVPQKIDYAKSINIQIKNEGDRNLICPADPNFPAILYVTITKDFNDYIFFPRVSSGADVLVCEPSYPFKILFRLGGQKDFTPIANRYLLDLKCSSDGTINQRIDTQLMIILGGKWSQLWLSGGHIFFR